MTESAPDPVASQFCAERLKALGDQERLRIVQALRNGPLHVSQISEATGKPVVTVSHHLGILRRCGLVEATRQGRFIVYALHPDIYSPQNVLSEHLDLGCCRLELPPRAHEPVTITDPKAKTPAPKAKR